MNGHFELVKRASIRTKSIELSLFDFVVSKAELIFTYTFYLNG
jgi:hypothetical protein